MYVGIEAAVLGALNIPALIEHDIQGVCAEMGETFILRLQCFVTYEPSNLSQCNFICKSWRVRHPYKFSRTRT